MDHSYRLFAYAVHSETDLPNKEVRLFPRVEENMERSLRLPPRGNPRDAGKRQSTPTVDMTLDEES